MKHKTALTLTCFVVIIISSLGMNLEAERLRDKQDSMREEHSILLKIQEQKAKLLELEGVNGIRDLATQAIMNGRHMEAVAYMSILSQSSVASYVNYLQHTDAWGALTKKQRQLYSLLGQGTPVDEKVQQALMGIKGDTNAKQPELVSLKELNDRELIESNTAVVESKVQPMYGSLLIDGYDFKNDVGPKGTIIFDPEKNEFRGSYIGLKMPAGRKSIFAWVHDTVNQKSEYIGPVGWLRNDTGGKRRGKFTISVPDKFKGGNFGSFEIIGFTAEKTSFLNVTKEGIEVLEKPTEPSGSDIRDNLKPAFYLYAPLPGSDTEIHYCGHGGDFFFAKDLDKQFCYD